MVSVILPVPPSGRPAGACRRASRPGYWAGGGLVAARIGVATARVAQAATRVLYSGGPRAAAPPGWLGTGVTGPAGNPVAVSAWRGDLRLTCRSRRAGSRDTPSSGPHVPG